MKKWEYNYIYYRKSIDSNFLNELGEQGWELILIIARPESVETKLVFKREKIEKADPTIEEK